MHACIWTYRNRYSLIQCPLNHIHTRSRSLRLLFIVHKRKETIKYLSILSSWMIDKLSWQLRKKRGRHSIWATPKTALCDDDDDDSMAATIYKFIYKIRSGRYIIIILLLVDVLRSSNIRSYDFSTSGNYIEYLITIWSNIFCSEYTVSFSYCGYMAHISIRCVCGIVSIANRNAWDDFN